MKNSYQEGGIKLRHFVPSEFGRAGFFFYKNMSHKFLVALDELSNSTGYGIKISPHSKAIGRVTHDGGTSQHDITATNWFDNNAKVVLSVADIMPFHRDTGKPLNNCEARKFIAHIIRLGFTGVGVYPHWSPMPGFHVDMRVQPEGKLLSTWGALKEVIKYEDGFRTKQIYHGLDYCMDKWGKT